MTPVEGAEVPPSRRIGLPTKLFYGVGSVAYGIKDNGFQMLLLLYYNQVIGIRADLVGLAILIALVLDAFIDPLVGHFSDHLRSRWGRRHPFMYAAAIPVGVLYLLLWHPPTSSPTVTLLYLIVVAVAVRTAISCYEVPSSALAPELTADYAERTSVLGFRYLFGWAGGMGMALLTFVVLLAPTAQYPNGQLNPAGYDRYASIAALAMTAAILISSLGTHNQIKYLPKVTFARAGIGDTFRGILGTLRNRAFLILLLSGIFSFTAQGITFALSAYINTYFWRFSAVQLGLFTLAVMGGVMLAFGIATLGTRRFGKRETSVVVFICYPFVAASPFALRYAGLFPANGDPILFPLLMGITLIGAGLGIANTILGASMMADVVEDAQQRSGQRSEGLYFGGNFFMQKCVSGLGLLLTGWILESVQFPRAAVPGAVASSVLANLATTYAIVLVVLSIAAAFVIFHFPLGGRADHERRLALLVGQPDALGSVESHAVNALSTADRECHS